MMCSSLVTLSCDSSIPILEAMPRIPGEPGPASTQSIHQAEFADTILNGKAFTYQNWGGAKVKVLRFQYVHALYYAVYVDREEAAKRVSSAISFHLEEDKRDVNSGKVEVHYAPGYGSVPVGGSQTTENITIYSYAPAGYGDNFIATPHSNAFNKIANQFFMTDDED